MDAHYSKDLDNLICDVVKDSALEKAWIVTFSHVEFLAASHIRNNITKDTPQHEIERINEHANEEDNHGELLKSILKHFPATESGSSYEIVEKRFREIGQSFMNAYFGNDLLTSLRSRHAAYVHGAMTIEKFPFQVYGAYLKQTNCVPIKKVLPKIIADENGHLSLGQNLRKQLPKDRWLSIKNLDILQMELGHLQVKRMHKIVKDLNSTQELEFESEICEIDAYLVAWLYTMALNMKIDFPKIYEEYDLTRLRKAILLKRRGYSQSAGYKEIERHISYYWEIYFDGLDLHTLQNRMVNHLNKILTYTYDMGVAWALEKILENRSEIYLYLNKEDYFSEFIKQSLNVMKANKIEIEINERWR